MNANKGCKMKYVVVVSLLLGLTACDSTSNLVDCIDGCSPDRGEQGSPGIPGLNGSNGEDGVDGHNALVALLPSVSCENGGTLILSGVDVNDDNALEGEEVQSSADVCNGEDAPESPYAISEIVDPCGNAPGIYDEVLLRLANGTLLASFSDNANGKNTRFSVLTPGSYITTDGSNCHFSVNNQNQIVY